MEPSDKLVVVEFFQDADSFGWHIAAIFNVEVGPWRRWGVLDGLVGTNHGARNVDDTEDVAATVRHLWHLVDWYKDEQEARNAFVEMKSRQW